MADRAHAASSAARRRLPQATPNAADQPIHRVKAEFFRILGHPARVRILEFLRVGERSVGDLQLALGSDSSSTSQHLGALRRQGLLASRREGTSVFYRVNDPRTFQLLEISRQILTGHFEDTQELLGELVQSAPSAREEPS